jgi:hypothetical protein
MKIWRMNNMDRQIYISYMTDQAIDTLNSNQSMITEKIKNNIHDSNWINDMVSGNIYEERKFKIKDFELKTSIEGNYSSVELENAIILFNTLKELPRYILTDERFWAWITVNKCYRASVQAMPLKYETTFANTWLFGRGNRRGIFFNKHARSFFWVEFTIDETLEDKYEYTKFVFEKHDRIRYVTFDAKPHKIVFNTVKAEKKLFDRYANDAEYSEAFRKCESGVKEKEGINIYTYIRKFISLYGSARILDVMSDEDLCNVIYLKLERFLLKVKNGDMSVFEK